MDEPTLIALLRGVPLHPGARGLTDDAAIFTPPLGRDLVVTHDMLVEGTHYLAGDPPSDVAWKLLATNLSDLAGKGAEPLGVLLGLTLVTLAGGDGGWDRAFVEGLGRALGHFNVRLLGGDTVSGAGRRVLGLTAIGTVPPGAAPSRSGARPGDRLWVSGTIGDAGLGLAVARGELEGEGAKALLRRYRRPTPRLTEGVAAAAHTHAMMDVSDGLLIDAARMADASQVAIEIDLSSVPLSPQAMAFGNDLQARLSAVTAGDDYELLAAAPDLPALGFSCIGRVLAGSGLSLISEGQPVPLPDRLGFQHAC